jgi:hypothetical protein
VKQLLTFEAEVQAGNQFVGTEFFLQFPRRKAIKLIELNLQMGTEAKTFRVEKRNAAGQAIALIQQSVDTSGVPGTTSAESLILSGSDLELLFEEGDRLAITTTGATSAMRSKAYFVETDFSN